jgi:hypothetical protein
MIHPVTKQLMFMGRSDGVLNPSGVRFGSAEIYKVIENEFAKEVTESICVGQRRPEDNDERVFLFLLMKPEFKFSEELSLRVKAAIRKALSARHVPAFVFPTPEIPVSEDPQTRASIANDKLGADNHQREEGRASYQADYIWKEDQRIRSSAES